MPKLPPFHLEGAVAVNGRSVRQHWGTSDLSRGWTILAVFPSSHTPVCQATCLGLSDRQGELRELGAQAFGLCTNYIADIAAWVEAQNIAIPILSDFLTRTAAGGLSGLNPDGTARRGTYLIAPGGEVVWQHVDCEQAAHHVEEAMAALRQNAPQQPTGAISGDFGAMVVSEAPAAANQPTAAQRRYLVREQEESYR